MAAIVGSSPAATGASARIRIEGLTKSFGDVEVLKGITLDIQPGEFFTLLGSSGCGKTTLLRCIAGFEQPTAGRILFADRTITSLNPWERNVGFVFQNYALWPHLTVFDNIAYGLRMRRLPRQEIAEKVRTVLGTVNLPGIEKRFPGQLSGGQQQRIAIARALVINPLVLLLDEPLSNLDAKLRIRMRKDIHELQRRLGITSIYVTHDQEEALEISDRIAVMEDGRLRQIGEPVAVYEHPSDGFTAGFVGKSNFIEGRVIEGAFHTERGVRIPLPTPPLTADEAVLCFRPENVVLAAREPGSFDATIVDAVYLGSSFQLSAQLADGTEFVIDVKERAALGSLLTVRIERYHLFPRSQVRG